MSAPISALYPLISTTNGPLINLETLHPSPHQTIKDGCQHKANSRGSKQLLPEVWEVVAEAVAGVSPEAAGRVHEAAEHDLAGDEGHESEADLLHRHAQGLISLVHAADVDKEVTNPTQAQHKVEDKLSDEEGHEWRTAVGLTIARSNRV